MSFTRDGFRRVRKIAVIGAGQSGLCAIRHFSTDPAYDVTAYEQQNRVGGLWNYPEGCEEHSTVQDETSPYFCRMHRNLVSNLPKFHQVFAGDITEEMDMFPTLQRMNVYLTDYAEKYGLLRCIKFRHEVKSISPVPVPISDNAAMPQWTVTTLNLPTNTEASEIFDVVLVCSGQYRKSFIPEVPTIETFSGTVIHSGEYRNREHYKDQNVLIIGDGLSADDLICDLRGFAKSLFLVRRRFQSTFDDRIKYPNIYRVPEPLKFLASGLALDDGLSQVIDTVILCTGYVLHFPFLTPDCKVEYNRGHAWPLYRHTINCHYPTMAFIGCIQKIIPVMTVVEEQVKHYKAWLDGAFKLPSSEEMTKQCDADYKERIAEGAKEHRAHNMFPFEKRLFPYLDLLAEEGNFKPWSKALGELWTVSAWKVILEPCTARNYHYELTDENTYLVNVRKADEHQ